MTYKCINTEYANHVTMVTLNRPARRNALDLELLTELEQCANDFRNDTETRAVIFTGSGKHFSSGVDLDYLRGVHQQPMIEKRRQVRLGERVFHALLDIEQITICAWNGAALGGGACIATALDLRIGSDDCFVQYPEIDLGMNLMWQCLPRTTRLVGDVEFDSAAAVAGAITPVPGGVGPMTIACLLHNTLQQACRLNDLDVPE